jgi:hypothetical protein
MDGSDRYVEMLWMAYVMFAKFKKIWNGDLWAFDPVHLATGAEKEKEPPYVEEMIL